MAEIYDEALRAANVNVEDELEEQISARRAEIKTAADLETQRGTPIPALFNQFFKFIQNPSTVSVETFKRMVDTDDTIGAGVDFLTTCIVARLGRYQHKSEEITKFVNDNLNNLQGGWASSIKELASATWSGFMVQEKVWRNKKEGFYLDELVSLPPTTILFEVDRRGKLTEDGILQYQRNLNPHILGGGMGPFNSLNLTYGFSSSGRPDNWASLGDYPYALRVNSTFNYLAIRIPTQKCVHYAFDAQGKFGNPYGRSLLRRAYKWHVLKDAFLQMMAIAMDRKGTPLTVVFVDPNTTLLDSDKYNPNVQPGQQRGVRADLAAKKAFENIHNDSVILLPGKKGQIFDVEAISQQSNVQDFISAIDLCNKSILRSLLIPSLIFGNGDGTGSFALGQEHARTFDKILDGHMEGFKDVLLNQIIKEIIAYNFPRSAWEKDGLGDFSKRDLSRDEIEKEMEVIEKGVTLGVIDTNDLEDLNKIREVMGFTIKTDMPEKPEDFNEQDDEEQLLGSEEISDGGETVE